MELAVASSCWFTHLENVERLELNVPTAIAQEVHHQLQISLRRNVPRHYRVVCAVQENLAQELQRLTFCHVVV